jgi:hypothetical protein
MIRGAPAKKISDEYASTAQTRCNSRENQLETAIFMKITT